MWTPLGANITFSTTDNSRPDSFVPPSIPPSDSQDLPTTVVILGTALAVVFLVFVANLRRLCTRQCARLQHVFALPKIWANRKLKRRRNNFRNMLSALRWYTLACIISRIQILAHEAACRRTLLRAYVPSFRSLSVMRESFAPQGDHKIDGQEYCYWPSVSH